MCPIICRRKYSNHILIDSPVLSEEDAEDLSERFAEAGVDGVQILSDEKENQISFFQSSIDQTKRELSEVETMERDQSAKIASMEQTYSVSVSVGVSETGFKYAGGDFLWPMPSSSTISSYYGTRVAPTAGASTEHKGIDISSLVLRLLS